MSNNTELFDHWLRTAFVEMNTELEEIYFAQENRQAVAGVGDSIKQNLVAEGNRHIVPLLREGNTDEGFDRQYNLLGCVGFFMAACRRHDITEPSRETTSPLVEASALALHLATTLGVTPRFATSHMATFNPAKDGVYRSFTSLKDEFVFLDYNILGIFAYQRAADALCRILPLGISHPLTAYLFELARTALEDVIRFNERLFDELDTDRFFNCVRPYYKPYRVGPNIYRGANAGDFAGINVIDLLLGLCSADNPSYAQVLVDKFLFMLPEEQALLKDCMRRKSFMDEFLQDLAQYRARDWFQKNLKAYLEVVALHGATAASHHDNLVQKFIEQPAAALPEEGLVNITASGPPLPVLLNALEKLRDLRLAADRNDIPSRHHDLEKLKACLL
ncbi:MAG: DUF1864 family protein [Gammaproteobacteria bacterium]|nr:DUF1864 family protein [Gammaproteobacteria bacterium]